MHGTGGGGPLRLQHAFSVAKWEDASNEDCWSVAPDGLSCALSDGASVSYDSAPWAAILVRRFVECPEVTQAWIEEASKEYRSRYDRAAMPWMHQAAFDRGSHATLLGLAYSNEADSANVFAIGDSLLALLDSGELVLSFPYTSMEEFDRSPVLLSTNSRENRSLDDQASVLALDLTERANPAILLMSDALGRWLLQEGEPARASMLLSIEDEETFRELVETERSSGGLRRDDTTLLVLTCRHESSPDY